MTLVRFKGIESKVASAKPYKLLIGNIAAGIKRDVLDICKNQLRGSGFAINDLGITKIKDRREGVLYGSTPDIHMVLWHYIPTEQKYGFLPATPQQMAHIYNNDLSFIENRFWVDIQLMRNPFASKVNGIWAAALDDEVSKIFGNEIVTIPYSVIRPLILDNGHLGKTGGYQLLENAEEKIKIVKWTRNDLNGFGFTNFDVNAGVPDKNNLGKIRRRFYGLPDFKFSRLWCKRCLDASAAEDFGDSDAGARVVGWETGEASLR